MQSVFSTKDDDVGSVNGVKFIVDDGKVIFRKTKTEGSDSLASWITEITTISSDEDNDVAAPLLEEVGGGDAKSDAENGVSADHWPDSILLKSELDADTPDDSVVWPAISEQNARRTPRMSLRQKTSSPQKTSVSEKQRRTSSKMICTRGRGGRLMRTLGLHSCRSSVPSLRQWSTETNDGAQLNDGIGKGRSTELKRRTGKEEFQLSATNCERSVVVDSCKEAADSDSASGRDTVSNSPAIDQSAPLADHGCNGETKPATFKNGSSCVEKVPKKSSIFDSTSKELFCKRRKVSFSKERQTSTDGSFESISRSSCAKAEWAVLNDNNRKLSSLCNKRKMTMNGIAPRPILPKPAPRRDHSSKEIEDLIEGSIKVAKIVDSTHQKVVSSAQPPASASLTSLRPPIVVIKAIGGKLNAKPLASAATAAATATANSDRKLKLVRLQEANDVNAKRSQTIDLSATDSRIMHVSQVLPANNSLRSAPLFRDLPLLLVKTVNNATKIVAQPSGNSKVAVKPMDTFKVLSGESGVTVKVMARCDDKLKLICDQGMANGGVKLVKSLEKCGSVSCAAPVVSPVAGEKPSTAEIVRAQTTTSFNDMLSMPRATKCKAIQKISAIVSAKRKPTVACRKRPRDMVTHSKDKVVASAGRPPITSVPLPPPPRLTPCSTSRTEEFQRRNLQEKLLASNLTIHPNLQCRVNIPVLERHPLVPRTDREYSESPSPPRLLPISTVLSEDMESPISPPSLENDKRPHGRTRITHRTTITAKTRFSRNGRRIGRPPVRCLAESGRDASPSESDLNSPTSIVNQELKRLRLLPPASSDWEPPGSSRMRPSSFQPFSDQPLRSSVRQTECAFRYREISLRKHDNFTQIVLTSSTRVKNGLNVQVLRELKMALDAARTDKNCHVVLLNGTGSVFCSGIDLISLVKDGEHASCAKEMANAMREFSKAVMSFPKTLVAAVNGAAVGLGVTMLPLFDLVYASDKATFYTPYTKLGQIPEGGATFSLPFCMGFARANGLLMSSRRITATEAFECGLVTQVLWPSALMEFVIPQVQALAKQSLQTVGSAKALIRYHSARQLEVTLDIECRILSELWASSECIQSIREFLDKEEVV